MSSIFQAITRPADDFLEVGSSLFSSNTKTVHPGRRIRLIDRTADDDETEPLIPPSHADTAGAALARRQAARQRAQQDIAEEPNAPPIVRNAESRESEGPEVSTAADRGTDGPSSSSAAEEDPTMALTSDVAAEETSDETAPLLRRENDDGYGQPADSVARKRFNKRSCTVRLEHTVLRIISCLFFCCPTSFEGIDEEGEYMIGDEGDIIPVIPSRFTRHGYEQLKEEQKMVKAGNGIFSADPNIAYDVLYENQRGLFMFGQPFFSSQGLLQVDPPAWVDADFRYSPFDILSTPLPDPSWEWVWRTWYIDMTYDVDDQGWSYSFSFPSGSWHGAHVWFHSFVRRRRWIRKRRRVKNDGSEEEYPTALGIRDHNKERKAYSIVEGTTLNYFSVESSAVRARADHERRKHVKKNLTALPAVSEDGGKVDSAQGDDNIGLDYWFSDDEEDDGGSTERTFTIGALMRRLKKVRLDREKIDAVERFVCLGKDDIVLLAPFMDRIVSYLIFQQSRRELLRSLLFYYKQIRAKTRLLRTGKKEAEDDFETNSHALSHANHATLQLESMSLDDLKLRRKALHQAIVLARQEVMKLDFYSDRKMSNKEYAKADLMGDSYGSTYSTPQMSTSYKSSMSIQERILEETLEDVEAEELLEEDEVETPEESGKVPEEDVENDDDGDTGTLVPQTSDTSSQKDKGKIPEYRMPTLSRTSEYEARADENKDPKDSDRESTISAVRNKVLSFVSGS